MRHDAVRLSANRMVPFLLQTGKSAILRQHLTSGGVPARRLEPQLEKPLPLDRLLQERAHRPTSPTIGSYPRIPVNLLASFAVLVDTETHLTNSSRPRTGVLQMAHKALGFQSTLITWFAAFAIAVTFPAHAALIQWSVSEGGNDHYYEAVLSPSPIDWQTARDDAISKGGDLVSITSLEENSFVFGLIDSPEFWALAGPHNFGPWIGGYQVDNNAEPSGNWAWTDGDAWSFTSWASGQPDNAGGLENHAHYFVPANARSSTWNDWVGTGVLIKGYVLETLAANPDADFDDDGDIDGADFLKWQRGETPGLGSAEELVLWESQYGSTVPAVASSVSTPEPSSLLLVCLAGLLCCSRKRRV
jgi:hypothetical protein